MTPAAIIRQARAEGVSLALSPAGTIKASGAAKAVNRWLPAIRANKAGLVAVLAKPELFAFASPADPDSDREALEERAGIIAEGCGMDPAEALQEARWQVHRERAWRAFLRNARRILDAPEGARGDFIERYEAEAAGRYGKPTATGMAGTMRGWVAAQARET